MSRNKKRPRLSSSDSSSQSQSVTPPTSTNGHVVGGAEERESQDHGSGSAAGAAATTILSLHPDSLQAVTPTTSLSSSNHNIPNSTSPLTFQPNATITTTINQSSTVAMKIPGRRNSREIVSLSGSTNATANVNTRHLLTGNAENLQYANNSHVRDNGAITRATNHPYASANLLMNGNQNRQESETIRNRIKKIVHHQLHQFSAVRQQHAVGIGRMSHPSSVNFNFNSSISSDPDPRLHHQQIQDFHPRLQNNPSQSFYNPRVGFDDDDQPHHPPPFFPPMNNPHLHGPEHYPHLFPHHEFMAFNNPGNPISPAQLNYPYQFAYPNFNQPPQGQDMGPPMHNYCGPCHGFCYMCHQGQCCLLRKNQQQQNQPTSSLPNRNQKPSGTVEWGSPNRRPRQEGLAATTPPPVTVNVNNQHQSNPFPFGNSNLQSPKPASAFRSRSPPVISSKTNGESQRNQPTWGGLDVLWREVHPDCQRLMVANDIPKSAEDRGYFTVGELLKLKRALVKRLQGVNAGMAPKPAADASPSPPTVRRINKKREESSKKKGGSKRIKANKRSKESPQPQEETSQAVKSQSQLNSSSSDGQESVQDGEGDEVSENGRENRTIIEQRGKQNEVIADGSPQCTGESDSVKAVMETLTFFQADQDQDNNNVLVERQEQNSGTDSGTSITDSSSFDDSTEIVSSEADNLEDSSNTQVANDGEREEGGQVEENLTE